MQNLRYITAGSAAALAALLINACLDASKNVAAFQQKEAEKSRIETAKELADFAAKNQIARFEKLVVKDYDLSPKPPRLDWNRTVDPGQKTFIYDRNRICVGHAYDGRFTSITQDPTACNQGENNNEKQ